MKINYYRQPNSQGTQESWESCQFTSDTDLSAFTIKPLVTINGQPILRQHHVTYLTGKETCRAHHFAKHLAIQVLTSNNNKIGNDKSSMAPRDRVDVCSDSVAAPSSNDNASVASDRVDVCSDSVAAPSSNDNASAASDRVNVDGDSVAVPSVASRRSACKVLWIDTLHGPHISAAIYHELAAHAINKQDLHFICLDILAGQRYDFWYINRAIETLIKQKKPNLVVIDDIDHFMPHCGINIATEVTHVVRDVINHSETAFLFIGYNHLSKKTNTTGNLGKQLFVNANDVFSLSTQREVTTVRHAISYDLSCHPDVSEFNFTIGTDNLPHETTPVKKDKSSPIDDDTLCDIVADTLQPGETFTPDEFHRQVTTRHRQLKQQDRTATLLTQALHLNLITPVPDNNYTLTPINKPMANSRLNEISNKNNSKIIVSSDRVNGKINLSSDRVNGKVNVSSDRVDVCSDSVAATPSKTRGGAHQGGGVDATR